MRDPATLLDPPDLRLPPHGPGRGGGRGGNGGGDSERHKRGDSSTMVFGVWLALVPILVLFLTLAVAYLLRQRGSSSTLATPLPRLLWFNTVLLLGSSLVLERGRAVLRQQGDPQRWTMVSFVMGSLFVLGQAVAWVLWWQRGMRPETTVHSAFFYILTGTHAVHVLGGLLFLGSAAFWPHRRLLGMGPALFARLTAIYWHFLAVLWIGLLLILELAT
jgi:cytochrome c oxidase subunit III